MSQTTELRLLEHYEQNQTIPSWLEPQHWREARDALEGLLAKLRKTKGTRRTRLKALRKLIGIL